MPSTDGISFPKVPYRYSKSEGEYLYRYRYNIVKTVLSQYQKMELLTPDPLFWSGVFYLKLNNRKWREQRNHVKKTKVWHSRC